MYDEFFSKAHELTRKGVPFATATVVRAEAPTSGKPGDRAIITADGVMVGWIGGSCAQPTVVKEAIKALSADSSTLIRLSANPESQKPRDGVADLPMTCFSGGTLEIFIEPHLPRPRLLIVGELPVAQALAHLGKAMNYHIVAVDVDGSGAMEHADEVVTQLSEIGEQIRPNTYTVIATHGNYDELAIETALRARPNYVGVVASRKRLTSIREYLTLQGFSEDDLLPLKAPAGLDIGARRGDEIALSIMAEIVQRRREAERIDVALLQPQSPPVQAQPISISLDMLPRREAIDPICGMSVDINTAKYMHEHDSEMYYFCCAGCKVKFAQEPAKYLAQEVPSGMAVDPICGMVVEVKSAEFMTERAGEFYYFCCEGCLKTFEKRAEPS